MSPGFANRFDNAMRGTCSNETQRFSEMCRDGNCHCRLQRMFTYSRNITVAEQATGGELKVSGTFSTIGKSHTQPTEKVLTCLRSLGNGSCLFGQMATWAHNDNPDMDRRIRPGIAWMWLKNWKPVIPNRRDLSSGVTMGIIM